MHNQCRHVFLYCPLVCGKSPIFEGFHYLIDEKHLIETNTPSHTDTTVSVTRTIYLSCKLKNVWLAIELPVLCFDKEITLNLVFARESDRLSML